MAITRLRPLALPLRSAITRRTRPAPSFRRLYSDKSPNPTAQFYKTFTRPIAKVLLVAVLTYQLLYWGWVKLEQDEYRTETDATIHGLEDKIEEYKASKNEEGSKNGGVGKS